MVPVLAVASVRNIYKYIYIPGARIDTSQAHVPRQPMHPRPQTLITQLILHMAAKANSLFTDPEIPGAYHRPTTVTGQHQGLTPNSYSIKLRPAHAFCILRVGRGDTTFHLWLAGIRK